MNLITPSLRSSLGTGAPVLTDQRGPEADRLPIIRQYLRIALRWRYVILGAIAACVLLGLTVTLLMTPKYTAVTTVEISRESDNVSIFAVSSRRQALPTKNSIRPNMAC